MTLDTGDLGADQYMGKIINGVDVDKMISTIEAVKKDHKLANCCKRDRD